MVQNQNRKLVESMNIILDVQHGWIVKDSQVKYFRTKPKWSGAQNKWLGNYRNTPIVITTPNPWGAQSGGPDKVMRIANGKFICTSVLEFNDDIRLVINTDGETIKRQIKHKLIKGLLSGKKAKD